MKRGCRLVVCTFILVSLLLTYVSADYYNEVNGVRFTSLTEDKADGSITLQGETAKAKLMIMLVKDNKQYWYDVKLEDKHFTETIWLTKGKGTYRIYVMVNVQDRQYSFGPSTTVVVEQEHNPYILPERYVQSRDKAIIDKAAEITGKAKTDLEKAKLIYEWVARNVDYDYGKYQKHLNSDYNNEYGALVTLKSGQGVCFDYSTLYAALGRAAGLQVKVVKGTGKLSGFNGYHAWNEVYITEQSRWLKLDSTFASVAGQNWFDTAKFDESHIPEDVTK